MILFYIFFFGTRCVSASLLTDGRKQQIDQNSVTSALQNMNKNIVRQLTNEENLVILAMSRTISVMTSDISKLKVTLADTLKRFDDLKQEFDKKLNIIKSENQEQISENEKRFTDMEKLTKVLEEDNNDLKKREVTLQKHFAEMNISMTKLQKEQAILNDDFSTNINTLRANVSDVQTDFDVKIRNMSVTVNKNNMEITNKILTADTGFGTVNRTIQNLKLNILQSQKKQADINVQSLEFQLNMSRLLTGLTTKVGFTAGITKRGTSATTTLVFPKVIYNSGGGYSPRTGIFTAPVTGHYVFYVAVASESGVDLYLDISVKGSSKVRTMSWDPYGTHIYQTGTNMVVYHLLKGDRVYVKRYSGNGHYTESVPITTFSGFLL